VPEAGKNTTKKLFHLCSCQSFELAEMKEGMAGMAIAFCNSSNKIITFIGLVCTGNKRYVVVPKIAFIKKFNKSLFLGICMTKITAAFERLLEQICN
jgi:hypothetical protein